MHLQNKTMGPQAANLVMTLHERRHLSFHLSEAMEITGLKAASARSFLRALVDRGIAARLRPGLFNLVPFEMGRVKEYLGNPYVVARELMRGRDYYVSHASALDIHRMTTQPQLVVYVSSPHPMRKRIIFGTEFRFVLCPKKRFSGFSEAWVDKQERVLVSGLERTVLDGLRAPEYCGGVTEVAKGFWMRRSDMDVRGLVKQALQMDSSAIMGRLGYLMEILEIGAQSDRDSLRARLGGSYVRLDSMLPNEGKLLARWRLRLNIAAEEIRAVLQT